MKTLSLTAVLAMTLATGSLSAETSNAQSNLRQSTTRPDRHLDLQYIEQQMRDLHQEIEFHQRRASYYLLENRRMASLAPESLDPDRIHHNEMRAHFRQFKIRKLQEQIRQLQAQQESVRQEFGNLPSALPQ